MERRRGMERPFQRDLIELTEFSTDFSRTNGLFQGVSVQLWAWGVEGGRRLIK